MTTIKDVAALAGVSKSTVSRVMNDGYVDTKTREKIEWAIKELDYRPNSFAKNIRTGKSNLIALMIPDLTNKFYSEIFKVVEKVAFENGYMVLLCDTNRSIKNEITYVNKLLDCNVDGLLYFAQEKTKENEDFFYGLAKKLPVVFMNRAFGENKDISYVSIEGVTCTIEAVRYLFDSGKRRIAYVDLPRKVNVDKERYDGYVIALEKCGLELDESIVYRSDGSSNNLISEGYNSAKFLMTNHPDIDAVISPADQLAVGVIKYLQEAGFKIPEQVSVVGFDDIDLCTVVKPTLSTIQQPIYSIARDATNILIAKINGKHVENDRIDYKGIFIKRESV